MRDGILEQLSTPICGVDDAWPAEWVQAYRAERLELTRSRTKVCAVLVCAVVLSGTLVREVLLTNETSSMVSTIAVALAAWIGLCGFAATRLSSRLPAAFLCVGTAIACSTMVAFEGGLAALPWPSLMLLLLAAPLLFPMNQTEMLALVAVVLASFLTGGVAVQTSVDHVLLVDRLLWLGYASVVAVASARVTQDLRRHEFAARQEADSERGKSERLLLNVLPEQVASRLKTGEVEIADGHDHVSVLFADLVGFTELSARSTPAEVVALLDHIVKDFDRLAVQHGLEKIKTIGDCYMVAAGIPEPREDHAEAAAAMAMDLLAAVRHFNETHDADLQVRVGLHCGPVVAGVIGEQKFAYDLWGDTGDPGLRRRAAAGDLPGRGPR
jgi:class 3 adenylate cyclase